MERDNSLEYLFYIKKISSATFSDIKLTCLFANGLKIFNYLLLKIFRVIDFHQWKPLMKIFYNKFFQTTEHTYVCKYAYAQY